MKVRVCWVGLVVGVALSLTACGADSDPEATAPPAVADKEKTTVTGREAQQDAGGIKLRAEKIAFDAKRIEIAAGRDVTISFDNADKGVPHNLHVTAGSVDVMTEVEPGPTTQKLTVRVEEPGTYSFVCDVHPVQMKGELVAT